MHPADPNIAMLESVVTTLGTLADDMVFVGGCAAGLLITDTAAPEIRTTTDVDALVEVVSLREYHKLSTALRSQGFVEDQSPEAPIARWRNGSQILDVMPTDASVLGFGNEWYPLVFRTAVTATLPNGYQIRHISAPSFLATKLSAFDGRGGGDYLNSHDMEDFIAVIDGRSDIIEEIETDDTELAKHLAQRATLLLGDPGFDQALPGLLPPDPGNQARVPRVRQRLAAIADRHR